MYLPEEPHQSFIEIATAGPGRASTFEVGETMSSGLGVGTSCAKVRTNAPPRTRGPGCSFRPAARKTAALSAGWLIDHESIVHFSSQKFRRGKKTGTRRQLRRPIVFVLRPTKANARAVLIIAVFSAVIYHLFTARVSNWIASSSPCESRASLLLSSAGRQLKMSGGRVRGDSVL